MHRWVAYRVRAQTPEQAVGLIEHYSDIIKRPDSGHSYGFRIGSIFKYNEKYRFSIRSIFRCNKNGKYEFGYIDDCLKNSEAAWIKEVNTEEKYINIVKDIRMRRILYKFYTYLGEDYKFTVDNLCEQYTLVSCREDERQFIREIDEILSPLAHERWSESMYKEENDFDLFWKHFTSEWRAIKRHTSSFSFPFVRPGMDIYRSWAYDIGVESDIVWYSNVYYKY